MMVIILLGRSGSGKGTQAEILVKKFGFKLISAGDLLRLKAKDQDFVGKKIAEIISKGGILPTPVVFDLWFEELKRIKEDVNPTPGIVFEGSPRKLFEVHLLQEALEFFDFNFNLKVFWLNVSKEEAKRRLLKRGRQDDTLEAINKRFEWYQKEVVPVIDFYKKKGLLIEINGEQEPEKVSQEIIRYLNQDFKNFSGFF